MRLAADFATSRASFLDAARAAGARIEEHAHPLAGPSGEPLGTDVACLGRPGAPARLLVVSGTHGVEGFAGSACQAQWLAEGISVPDDLAVVLVHAINPYGFAWVRRVNEDNVDLNRNFVDFGAPLPQNPGYDELADALVPERWDETTQQHTAEVLLGYATEHGFDGLQAAVSGGQYRHPGGVFFGGARPVWSHDTLRAIVSAHVEGAERVAVIDLHTGLGPFGVGELIAHDPDPAEKARLADWYGAFTVPTEGSSVSAATSGDILGALKAWLPGLVTTAIAIEWGTVDIVSVSNALRADAWLHAHGDPRGAEAAAIKAELRSAFAPDDAAWAELVWERFSEIEARAIAGLLG